jgi:hypothetical protein
MEFSADPSASMAARRGHRGVAGAGQRFGASPRSGLARNIRSMHGKESEDMQREDARLTWVTFKKR